MGVTYARLLHAQGKFPRTQGTVAGPLVFPSAWASRDEPTGAGTIGLVSVNAPVPQTKSRVTALQQVLWISPKTNWTGIRE